MKWPADNVMLCVHWLLLIILSLSLLTCLLVITLTMIAIANNNAIIIVMCVRSSPSPSSSWQLLSWGDEFPNQTINSLVLGIQYIRS